MKKISLLNQPLSNVIAVLLHLDTLVITDAGLPFSAQTQRIDFAVSANIPPFFEVLHAKLRELQVEGAIIAAEIVQRSPAMYEAIVALLEAVPKQKVPHKTFKLHTQHAHAAVWSGEFTPMPI